MDIKLFSRVGNIILVLFSHGLASDRNWCHFQREGEMWRRGKFVSNRCLFDPVGWGWRRDCIQYSLYECYLINFFSLLLNGFSFFCLLVLGFFFGKITLVEAGMERRKMAMEIMLSCCIDCSCCIGHFFCWNEARANPFGGYNLYLLTSSYTAVNTNLNVSKWFCA